MNPYSILLVDDHQIVRQGLRSILEEDTRFQVIGEASTAKEAYDFVKDHSPDIVILDLKLPDSTGAILCRQIMETAPKTIVFILTAYYESQMVYGCLQAGARGYLIKDVAQMNLPDQLMAAVHGHTALDQRAADILADCIYHHKKTENELSNRELEVMRLIAQGFTNYEIALELHIKVNTIKSHTKEIFTKLGVHNRVEAVIEARKRDLL